MRSNGVVTIEVFADIWCPFTHVGLRRIVDARHRAGHDDMPVVVRAWPLELINGAPMDPAATRAKGRLLREQVAPTQFTDVAEHFPTSTLAALALESRAYQLSAGTGLAASLALRDALFEHGRDISDPAVLADVATALGIGMPDEADSARVLADHEEGQRRGVIGSPHFFHGPDSSFCPSLDIRRDDHGELVIRLDAKGLDDFLARCFAG